MARCLVLVDPPPVDAGAIIKEGGGEIEHPNRDRRCSNLLVFLCKLLVFSVLVLAGLCAIM